MKFTRNPRFECVGKNALVYFFFNRISLGIEAIEPGEKRSATRRIVTRRIGLFIYFITREISYFASANYFGNGFIASNRRNHSRHSFTA